jgi:hypothetical protein
MLPNHVKGLEKLVADLGAVQQLGHEDEQRDGHQHVVFHDAPGVVGKHVEQGTEIEPVVDEPEQGRHGRQGVGQGMAEDNRHDQRYEHRDS